MLPHAKKCKYCNRVMSDSSYLLVERHHKVVITGGENLDASHRIVLASVNFILCVDIWFYQVLISSEQYDMQPANVNSVNQDINPVCICEASDAHFPRVLTSVFMTV